jgi:hypothetical protein
MSCDRKLVANREVHAVDGPAERWLGRNDRGKDIMRNATVSKCANPQCEHEFKRMNEGKLYVSSCPKNNGSALKALWLCPACAREFELDLDPQRYEYLMIRRQPIALVPHSCRQT